MDTNGYVFSRVIGNVRGQKLPKDELELECKNVAESTDASGNTIIKLYTGTDESAEYKKTIFIYSPNIKHSVWIKPSYDAYLKGNIKKIVALNMEHTEASGSTLEPAFINSLTLDIPSNSDVPKLIYKIYESDVDDTDMCTYLNVFDKKCKIYVPNSMVDKFKNSDEWFIFARNIYPISSKRVLDSNKQWGIESDIVWTIE